MTEGNGKGVVVTPEQVMTEYAAKQRRARKPTVGEVEDAFNGYVAAMEQRFYAFRQEMQALVQGRGGDRE